MSTSSPTDRTRRAWLLPSLQGYDRRWLRLDVVAGIAAGTVVIPQAMAYATIAGLPVEVGLYTCMLPMLVYALLGGSRSLSISTTSTIAILAASALSTLPSSRVEDDLLRDAFTLTTLVGLCLLAMRLFRLGSLVEQISPATLSGVKAGVGLTVAATQLPALLGISGDKQDEGFFGKVADALSKLGDANAATVCVSAASIVVLLVLRRVAPQVPGPLVVAAGGILLVALTDIEEHGLSVIGAVPSGLPTPTMPVLHDVGALLPGALAIAVMAFMETVLVARAQRQRAEPPVDSDQELLANGFAALAGGLSQCMPPAGGFSQSAVNQRAGAKSQLAGVVTAVLAVLVALFLGPVLEDLPNAVLAAMVMVAVVGLVSPADFVRYWRIDRAEFWVAAVVAGDRPDRRTAPRGRRRGGAHPRPGAAFRQPAPRPPALPACGWRLDAESPGRRPAGPGVRRGAAAPSRRIPLHRQRPGHPRRRSRARHSPRTRPCGRWCSRVRPRPR